MKRIRGPRKGWSEWFWDHAPALVGLALTVVGAIAAYMLVRDQTANQIEQLRAEAAVANAAALQRTLVDAVARARRYSGSNDLEAVTEALAEANRAAFMRSDDIAARFRFAITQVDGLCHEALRKPAASRDDELFAACLGVRVFQPVEEVISDDWFGFGKKEWPSPWEYRDALASTNVGSRLASSSGSSRRDLARGPMCRNGTRPL